MSLLPLFTNRPQRVYENILAFRTHSTVIRTWIERTAEGPDDQEDYITISTWISANRPTIDGQPLLATAEMLTQQFPRIAAVEVLNGSKTNGVLIYPRWA